MANYGTSNVLFCVLFLFTINGILAAPDVQLTTGIARGYDKQASETSKPYSVYYGIPFAEPPVGKLRFSPPQPYNARNPRAVITSDTFREACYQISQTAKMSEDCLHLNIFSPPVVASGARRKVMVWIHGGGFVNGDAAGYIPTRMVTDHDVIVVTLQYRLATLGFLSSGDEALPGNLGLHDQIMALRWVKDNIRLFGGDPDDITIFGESAGSASVSALSISPLTNGLFTKAILQSGTVFSAWAYQGNSRDLFYQHAKYIGCLPTFYKFWDLPGYHRAIVECLRSKPAKEITYVQPDNTGKEVSISAYQLDLLGYVVDNELIPRDPASLMADRNYLQQNGVLQRSYILGVNDNEASFSAVGVPPDQYGVFTDPKNVAPLIRSSVRGYLRYPLSTADLNIVDFMYTYPRQDKDEIPLQKIFDLNSDTNFVVPTIQFARAIVDASPSTPVYLYLFDSEPKLKDPNGPIQGTTHAMDLSHTFDKPTDPGYNNYIYFYAEEDPIKQPIISNAFRSYLTSFAKTDNPVASIGELWPRYDRQEEKYLVISSTPEVRERLFAQRVSLWLDIVPKLARSYWSHGERIAFKA